MNHSNIYISFHQDTLLTLTRMKYGPRIWLSRISAQLILSLSAWHAIKKNASGSLWRSFFCGFLSRHMIDVQISTKRSRQAYWIWKLKFSSIWFIILTRWNIYGENILDEKTERSERQKKVGNRSNILHTRADSFWVGCWEEAHYFLQKLLWNRVIVN